MPLMTQMHVELTANAYQLSNAGHIVSTLSKRVAAEANLVVFKTRLKHQHKIYAKLEDCHLVGPVGPSWSNPFREM
jgi:hypothetical protein